VSDTAMIRCLIADDQAMVRAGFGALLDAQPDMVVVGQAADGAQAVQQALELAPDVVPMDVRMPVMDGIEATRQIVDSTPLEQPPRVLMLTTFDLDEYVYEALRSGANVGRILRKLDLRDRAQAVIVAYESGLVHPGY